MTKDHARKRAIRARMVAAGEPYSVAARRIGDPGPESESAAGAPAGPETVAGIAGCGRRTLAEPSARIAFTQDWNVTPAEQPQRPGPLGRLVSRAIRAGWERLTRDIDNPGHMAGDGFIEPAAGRYMLSYGVWSEIVADGKLFGGHPGHELGTNAQPRRDERPGDVLWLLRLLPGVAAARHEGTGTVRGTPCHRFAVSVDAAAVAAAGGPAGLIRARDDGALELTVWIDGQHVRRVCFADRRADRGPEHQVVAKNLTLDLWDFGVSTASLDWTRLPLATPPANSPTPTPPANSPTPTNPT